MVRRPNTAVILARLNPLSLEPVSRTVEVGEYHDAWSLSPNRSQLALGISAPGRRGRVGILIVDLETMRVAREIETGIAAEALAWLAPRLIVAGLQRGGTVLVDPLTGEIVRRWPKFSDPQAAVPTRNGVVMLFPGPLETPDAAGAARLVLVDKRGRLRSVALERIRLAFREGVQSDEAGLAAGPGRARAYVFAADAPFAEVHLRRMAVAYRRVDALFPTPDDLGGGEVEPQGELSWRYRRALSVGNGRVLVFGRDDFGRVDSDDYVAVGAGAVVVDTVTWSSCVLDRTAGGAALVGGRVLAYGRGDASSRGLRAYTREGRKAFHLFQREHVWHAQGAGNLAYAHTGRAVYVVDVSAGKVVSEIAPRAELVDVVAGPS